MITMITNDSWKGLMQCAPDGYNGEIYSDVLYAQMLHESENPKNDNGMSQLYTEYNNCFGMKPSEKREKFWSGKVVYNGETFATYEDSSGQQSIQDRVNLDQYNKIPAPTSKDDVARYMAAVVAKGYATDSVYMDSWLRRLALVNPALVPAAAIVKSQKKAFGLLKTSVSIVFILIFLVLGWWIYRKFKKK